MKKLIFVFVILCICFFSFAADDATEEETFYTNLLLRCSNAEATVVVDGVEKGLTPYLLTSYQLPVTVLFRCEGYADRIVTITEPIATKTVELKVIELNKNEIFEKEKNKFYWSFARSLMLVGADAAIKAFSAEDSKFSKVSGIVIKSVIGVSVAETGYRLYRYYKSAKNLVY